MSTTHCIVGAICLAMLGAENGIAEQRTAPVSAQHPARTQPQTLDQELLDSLGEDPLDELDRGQPDRAPREPKPAPVKPGETLDEQLDRELGAAAVPEDDVDPLLAVARRMRVVGKQIAQARCGPETQQAQQAILADLDELIRQARRRGGSCSGSCAPKPGGTKPREGAPPAGKPGAGQPKPGGSGQATPGTAQAGRPGAARPDMDQMRVMLKQLWGELPERQREQMLQLPVEEFLPEYEGMIEDYFERLSQE